MIHVKFKKFKKYSIFRILGNETPPRDAPDARLETLKFILDNEPEFPNVIKCWVINCIHDKERRELISKMLMDRNQFVVSLVLKRKEYLNSKNKSDKVVHAININGARNVAINYGKFLSEFSFILDGDCFFSQDLWDNTRIQIENDQIKNKKRKFYSIPTLRTTFDNVLKFNGKELLSEPMVVFRYDSHKYFDEKIPFGEGDKLKFLYQLGHSQKPKNHNVILDETLCKSVGKVYHLTASDYEIELNQNRRIQLRNQSIDKIIWQIDNPEKAFPNYVARKHHKSNVCWSEIQNWFDFRGLYSQFAWASQDGCKFVEVGCWLGASICYLATEFKNRNKNATQIFAVDTWRGSDEDIHTKLIEKMGGVDYLYKNFLNNLKKCGVEDIVKPIRLNSVEASKKFEDESLDIVFIDASHKYYDVLNDINHWYPKIKKGGIICGHDYVIGHKVSEMGVVKAVNECFLGKNLEISRANRTWLHIKK